MKTAGNLVSFTAKFTAGMEYGHNSLECRDLRLFMYIYRNTAAVVDDAHVITRKKCHLNTIRKATHGLIA